MLGSTSGISVKFIDYLNQIGQSFLSLIRLLRSGVYGLRQSYTFSLVILELDFHGFNLPLQYLYQFIRGVMT